jgi:hypothetical protein
MLKLENPRFIIFPHGSAIFSVSSTEFIAMVVICESHCDIDQQFFVLMCMQKNINIQEAQVLDLMLQTSKVLKCG